MSKHIIISLSFLLLFFNNLFSKTVNSSTDPDTIWQKADEIINRIVVPTFPDTNFYITDYGAIGDSVTKCTEAFRKAIDSCHAAGGGRVVVPEGVFLTGAIHLKSNVNLHITKGAKVLFSQDSADYLPVVFTRYEGMELYNYSPFIYAFEQENIAITGSGTLNGQGESWQAWTGIDGTLLRQMVDNWIPVDERIFGAGHFLRPNMIQPYRCNNVLIDSITVLNGAMWHVHPVLCTNVTITNIKVVGHGRNNDGCNPESCTDVLIKNCYFDTGDDCIAFKAGRNNDGRRVPVPMSNAVVQNCTMKDGHGGIVLGSCTSAGINNIFAEDCYMDSPNLWYVLRIKTNSKRGGLIENINLRDITAGVTGSAALRINMYYDEGDADMYDPVIRNVNMENVILNDTYIGMHITCYERDPASNISLKNCVFYKCTSERLISNVKNLQMINTTINGNKPLQATAVPGVYEAENYDSARHIGWSNVIRNFNGIGYAELNSDSAFMEFKNVKGIEGTDKLTFRYINYSGEDIILDMDKDNENAGPIVFQPSDSVTGWDTVSVYTDLDTSGSTIRIYPSSGWEHLYFDHFEVNNDVTSLGAERELNQEYMQIIPIGSYRGFHVTINIIKEGASSFRVFDMNGRMIDQPKHFVRPGKYRFVLYSENLSPGIYVCSLMTSSGIYSQKVYIRE